MSSEYIRVDGVVKRFGSVCALHNLSFSVWPGEIVGLIGHNGAGKTTTMRILQGLLRPDAGEVYINGFSVTEHPAAVWRSSGYVAEEEGYYDYLNAYEYLILFSRIYGLSKSEAKRRTVEVIEHLGISDFACRKISSYSRGMRKKVSLARALLHSPELLILDSITEGLSPEFAEETRQLLISLARQETKTIVFSSHNLWEVEELCDRIVLIKNGTVLFEGAQDELIRKTKVERKVIIQANGEQDAIRKGLEVFLNLGMVVDIVNNRLLSIECNHSFVAQVVDKLASLGLALVSIEQSHPPSLNEVYMKLLQEA